MGTLYSDEHQTLKDLLASAGKHDNATLLIPDLQRPYVWSPMQVVVLLDSLVRGWPFGTLLTWKVKPDDPARELARAFWRLIDRTGPDEGEPISTKHPPATFRMVLDGQQRVQSLLLALGGDGWGFKMLDRDWHELLEGKKQRGPRGRAHWSRGCLCVNLSELAGGYAQTRRATAIDYTRVLKWVVTDDANGQSKLTKPTTYKDPLPRANDPMYRGQFVRLARLWEAAPDEVGIDSYTAEEITEKLFHEHEVSESARKEYVRATGALLLALSDVKRTRVTYLELAEYAQSHGTRETYNDAIVNIFTRLNTAGRTLTREDITFAWLKIGWNTAATHNEGAKQCIQGLAAHLATLSLPIETEDVVSAISFVWSVAFNNGELLNNNDLMRGDTIRPMAANISKGWDILTESATQVCSQIEERDLRFREHYQSLNAVAYLWAWYFGGLFWGQQRGLGVRPQDELEKRLRETLNQYLDRWLICSQWAGVWATSSADRIRSYALGLSQCLKSVATATDIETVIQALQTRLKTDLDDLDQAAIDSVTTMNADDRQQVRQYYTALWIWNRLDKNRWEKAQIALRHKTRNKVALEVDHVIAWDLWKSKLQTVGDQDQKDLLLPSVNALGNCMLLEKTFNISKSNRSLKAFLDDVHEFKNGVLSIESWADALGLSMLHVDCVDTPVDVLNSLMAERTALIRNDLQDFIYGVKWRIDTA